MSQVNKLRLSFAISLLTLVTSCANPPPAVDSTKLPQIAEQILAQANYFGGLFHECASLGGNAELTAISKQQDWLTTNWPLVAAADQIYTREHRDDALEFQGRLISPKAVRLAQTGLRRAQQELALEQRSALNQQKTCEFRLAQITQDNIHLSRDSQLAPYIEQLLATADTSAAVSSIARVPSLAGDIPLDLSPGHSYYRATLDNEGKCPSQAFTLVLSNNWPTEAYANFCGDQLKEVLSCEWGNCTASKL